MAVKSRNCDPDKTPFRETHETWTGTALTKRLSGVALRPMFQFSEQGPIRMKGLEAQTDRQGHLLEPDFQRGPT